MKKALIGYGGHAREVMAQMGLKLTCFVDDQYVRHEDNTVPLSLFNPDEYVVMIAISDPKVRFDISQKLPKETQYFTFIHPSVLLMGNVEIGEGSFIGANSILTTDIKLGKHSILNRGNHIGHDSIIGDYFSAMPGAIVSGNVTIYDCVYLGTNSSIKEKLTIVSGCTIGLNSGVVKDLKYSGTYGGTPAVLL
jgi:sugar O-acyltransferase (sialic acid O-acetyltransferase NeuD family)